MPFRRLLLYCVARPLISYLSFCSEDQLPWANIKPAEKPGVLGLGITTILDSRDQVSTEVFVSDHTNEPIHVTVELVFCLHDLVGNPGEIGPFENSLGSR